MAEQNHVLKKVSVQGFKSIAVMELDIRPLNILIGANGAGKTNLIQVFSFLRKILNRELQKTTREMGGANSLFNGSLKKTKSLKLQFDFPPNFYQISLLPTEEDDLFIENEKVGYQSPRYNQPYWEPIAYKAHQESQLRSYSNTWIQHYVINNITEWHVYHFHDTSATAPMKLTSNINDTISLRQDAGNLSAFLYGLMNNRPQYYRRIIDFIQLALPFFHDFVLEPDEEKIRLRWRQKGSEQVLGASALSDGSIRFICLCTLLLQPSLPKLLLIDEPELGLHPSAIIILAEMMKKASVESQIMVSTQSPGLVDQFDAEDIIVVEMGEEGSTFRRLIDSDLKEWLKEYSLSQLWENNWIGGKP